MKNLEFCRFLPENKRSFIIIIFPMHSMQIGILDPDSANHLITGLSPAEGNLCVCLSALLNWGPYKHWPGRCAPELAGINYPQIPKGFVV